MDNRLKVAFMVMGANYSYKKDSVHMENSVDYTTMFGVASIDEAKELAEQLLTQGYKCIELCGAFGEEGARAVIEGSKGEIAVGYCIHLPEQDELFNKVFG